MNMNNQIESLQNLREEFETMQQRYMRRTLAVIIVTWINVLLTAVNVYFALRR